MNETLKKYREQRSKLANDMRALIDKAETEKRDFTKEENEQHEKMFNECENLRTKITREERQTEIERDLAKTEIAKDEENRAGGTPVTDVEKRHRDVFRKYLSVGNRGLNVEEQRVLQAGSNVEGGYLTAPQTFVQELLKAVDNLVFIRNMATKQQLAKSESLGVPTLDTDLDDAEWTTELSTGSEDNALRFGKRELAPNPMAKRVKISKKLLRSSVMPIESIIMQRLSYKIGVTQEKGYLLGDGNKKPLGLFVASNDGISVGRDIAADNGATAPTIDGLINTKYAVKAAYWPKAQWLFHRDAVKILSKLKHSGTGEYAWRESARAGEPDMILGKPLNISEYVPNTFTTGKYIGMFGDFSYYWIVDALDLQIQRLTELYAESNQEGFIARAESDGAPVLEEAFARVTLG